MLAITVSSPDQTPSSRRYWLALFGLSLVGLLVLWWAGPPALHPAPAFDVASDEGQSISSGQLRGKPTLLVFWATWCAPCVEDAPVISQIWLRYRERINVLSVAVNDDPTLIQEFRQQYGWIFPNVTVSLDEPQDLPAKFGIVSLPAIVIIDQQGMISTELFATVSVSQIQAILEPLFSK